MKQVIWFFVGQKSKHVQYGVFFFNEIIMHAFTVMNVHILFGNFNILGICDICMYIIHWFLEIIGV